MRAELFPERERRRFYELEGTTYAYAQMHRSCGVPCILCGCRTDSFGEVAEVLSEVGDKEQTNLCQSNRTHCSPCAGHASRSWAP
jgi:hypothetical protein